MQLSEPLHLTDYDLQQMTSPPALQDSRNHQAQQQQQQRPDARLPAKQSTSRAVSPTTTTMGRAGTGFERVPKTLDSPLERLGLPLKEFAYIQYCVELMDSMKGTARRVSWTPSPSPLNRPLSATNFVMIASYLQPGSVTQQSYKVRPGVVALLTEKPEDPLAIVARLREVQVAQNMTCELQEARPFFQREGR